jgi:hypothetical protein
MFFIGSSVPSSRASGMSARLLRVLQLRCLVDRGLVTDQGSGLSYSSIGVKKAIAFFESLATRDRPQLAGLCPTSLHDQLDLLAH